MMKAETSLSRPSSPSSSDEMMEVVKYMLVNTKSEEEMEATNIKIKHEDFLVLQDPKKANKVLYPPGCRVVLCCYDGTLVSEWLSKDNSTVHQQKAKPNTLAPLLVSHVFYGTVQRVGIDITNMDSRNDFLYEVLFPNPCSNTANRMLVQEEALAFAQLCPVWFWDAPSSAEHGVVQPAFVFGSQQAPPQYHQLLQVPPKKEEEQDDSGVKSESITTARIADANNTTTTYSLQVMGDKGVVLHHGVFPQHLKYRPPGQQRCPKQWVQQQLLHSSSNGKMTKTEEVSRNKKEDPQDENSATGCVCGTIHCAPCSVFWVQCGDCDTWYKAEERCLGFSEEEAYGIGKWSCWTCNPPQPSMSSTEPFTTSTTITPTALVKQVTTSQEDEQVTSNDTVHSQKPQSRPTDTRTLQAALSEMTTQTEVDRQPQHQPRASGSVVSEAPSLDDRSTKKRQRTTADGPTYETSMHPPLPRKSTAVGTTAVSKSPTRRSFPSHTTAASLPAAAAVAAVRTNGSTEETPHGISSQDKSKRGVPNKTAQPQSSICWVKNHHPSYFHRIQFGNKQHDLVKALALLAVAVKKKSGKEAEGILSATLPRCLSWHLKGHCRSDCPKGQDHVPLNLAQSMVLEEF